MRKKYLRKGRSSNHKFEVVKGQELLARVPLPIAEVWGGDALTAHRSGVAATDHRSVQNSGGKDS
jgi:hypothetical protein